MSLERASLNQYTVKPLSLIEAADACVRHHIPSIALWRDKIAETGAKRAAEEIVARGLRVSSICRGGFFPTGSADEKKARYDDNLRAIDEAAILAADVLVLVCGPPIGRDLSGARAQIEDGIASLVPYARTANVKLGIEPLHPMLLAKRSAITTLSEANDLVDALGAKDVVGVVVDAYCVFWDAQVEREIARAGETIFSYQVADWVTPDGYEDVAAGRAMMGDGCIDFARLGSSIESASYTGPIEIEVLNSRLWTENQDNVVRLAVERYNQFVAEACV
ncbi:MAG TPA: sugar phosphate isomerase/epimerase family protein [Candidatus Rubrimentiphilum sp.]|nr:sugar phosphate isomerase/epimerase family protein [Candidatus Rubrimentiphilum sp.]